MTKTRKLLIAGVAGLALLAGVGIAAAQGMRDRHGMWGGGGMGGMGRICSDERSGWIDAVLGRAERQLDLTTEQRPAWDKLKDAIDRAETKVGAGCEQTAGLRGQGPHDPPTRLAAMEAMMTAGLDALKEVRPAVDEFYATLTPEQRERVESFSHRGRGWHRGWRDQQQDGPDAPDAGQP